MPNITIIGTGLIGCSLGLALKELHGNRFTVTGYDANSEAHTNAKKLGAVDRSEWNIDSAVRDADIVVLSTPANSIYEILETIGPFMKEGSVVTDTVSTKETVIAWAEELLPTPVSFVGGNPLVGAAGLFNQSDATPMLFRERRYILAPTPRASEYAVKQVVDLVEAIGAKPLFMDPAEHDSFTAAMTALPTIMAAALMDAVSSSPSWREIARFSGPEFSSVSAPSAKDPAISHGLAATNPEMVVYWIDELMSRLRAMRNTVADENARFDPDGQLVSTFVRAWEARARLEAGIVSDDGPRENSIPSASEGIMSLFLGNRAAKFLSSTKDKDDKDPTKYDRRRLN